MLIDERWQTLNPSDWEAFAREWLAERRGLAKGRGRSRNLAEEILQMHLTATGRGRKRSVGEHVLLMNLTATPDLQWLFIRAAVALAITDEDLCHIAVGPATYLLGLHGGDYIDAVEAQAAADPKFARMLRDVWRHMMKDKVWDRLQTIKVRYGASGPRIDNSALKTWLATPCRGLPAAVAKCVCNHVSALHSRGIEFHGYALLPSDRYDIRSILAATNSDAGIPVDVSDSRYRSYRYSVDEWRQFDAEGFESANALLADANEQFASLYVGDRPSFVVDEYETAHADRLLAAIVRGLEIARRARPFRSGKPFLAVWIPDSGAVVESVHLLNSGHVTDEFEAEFT